MTRYLRFALFALLPLTFSLKVFADPNSMLTLAPVLKNVMPAIVNVAVQGVVHAPALNDEDNEQHNNEESPKLIPEKPRKFQSIGSGVVIDPNNGIILTNDHVVRNATL